MNYPVWDIPASGLLIAVIAILNVFVSHFAVGGGFYLVLLERKARLGGDAPLLDYAKRLSRFFILLTLVFGAISGVGIWFTIGLVHPQATSSLINTFVWGWAIEWTFFVVEIAAAMVYYYGWDRLSARLHMAVGWVYVVSAWLSLVIINGILTYMLTPGQWPLTRGFWVAFFNETCWPALATKNVDILLLITDPSRRGLQAALRIDELARELNIGVGKSYLIINQVKEPPSAEALRLIAEAGVQLAGTVPEDRQVYDFDSKGRPTIQMPESSPCVQAAFAIFDQIVP